MCNWMPKAARTFGLALALLPVLALAACRPASAPPMITAAADSTPPATSSAPTPHVETSEPQWTEVERRQFVGQDLFNHIDGAAEVFLEMGFREVLVRLYSNGQAKLVHEVYEMKDPTAARGIYLRFRGRGTPVAGVSGRNFGNRYQIGAQKDRYFVQITDASGRGESLSAMTRLVNQALAAIPHDGDVPLLDLLPAEGLVPNSEVIVCGPYSLQSVFTLGDGDILQLQGQRCGIAGDYVTEHEGSVTRLIVPYGSAAAAGTAFQHLLHGLDSELQVLHRNEHTAVFREKNGQFGSITARDDKLDIRLHLVRDPGLASQPTVP